MVTRGKYLTAALPHPVAGPAQVFWGETSECVCQGPRDVFEFVGGVPRRAVFDNATEVGRRVGGEAGASGPLRRFAACYGLDYTFTSPCSGNEKGNVENKVGCHRRNLFVPVPSSRDVRASDGRLLTGDKVAGMVGSIAGVFPGAACQRRAARLCRSVPDGVPKSKRPSVAAMPEAIHAMESREASEAKAPGAAEGLEGPGLGEAARTVRDGYAETPTCARFPREHWRRVRTNDAIERPDREIRGRTRVVGTFPDGSPALMLVTARPRYVAESPWGSRRYLDVTLPNE